MAKKQPSDTDRLISHFIVAIAVGYIGSRIKGAPGAVVGAVVGAVAHYELDAPVAQVVAELS